MSNRPIHTDFLNFVKKGTQDNFVRDVLLSRLVVKHPAYQRAHYLRMANFFNQEKHTVTAAAYALHADMEPNALSEKDLSYFGYVKPDWLSIDEVSGRATIQLTKKETSRMSAIYELLKVVAPNTYVYGRCRRVRDGVHYVEFLVPTYNDAVVGLSIMNITHLVAQATEHRLSKSQDIIVPGWGFSALDHVRAALSNALFGHFNAIGCNNF